MRRSAEERKRWELVRDNAVHGALEWQGMARRRAVLTAGGASWRIGRPGVLRASFDITDAATGTAVGTFALGGLRSGGTLELPQVYRWRWVSALKRPRPLPLLLLACSLVAVVQKSDEDGAAAGAAAAGA